MRTAAELQLLPGAELLQKNHLQSNLLEMAKESAARQETRGLAWTARVKAKLKAGLSRASSMQKRSWKHAQQESSQPVSA